MPGTYNATIRRVVISAWIGNSIEYYDFLLYGLASALVFSDVFFPGTDAFTAMLSSFASFGVGFISRPVGALFFGNRGDTLGRKNTLLITLGGMGAVTFLIGCLPSYASIGALSPTLLITLRFMQGFMVGGEWSGAMLMVIEHASDKHRGLLSALSQTGGFTGQLLATGAFIIVARLPEEQLLSWGWRIPFLLSVFLVLPGIYMRRRLDETPVFCAFKKEQLINNIPTKKESPVVNVIRKQWRSILLIIILRFAESVPFFLATVFTVSWATTQLEINKLTMLYVVMITCLVAYPMHVLYGVMSDRKGYRQVYIFGALCVAVMAFPFFWLLESRSLPLIIVGYVLLINVGHNALNAVHPSFFAGLFHPPVRYSGSSIGAQLGAVVAGGFTPFIAKALSALYDNGWTLVAGYVVLTALASVLAAKIAPETVLSHSP
ncbi:MHS family MFS transporter [Salmonella bongori]|uniref:MFS transporter n=1 Tax=Salmonella bongori TaxID=54736 RepID=UPI0012871637|nr:MFS transporter [Salmonella bongori]ECG8259499.1 MFS transporter [Salmonella bongori serovar 48:i:-]ECG9252637.1 MHS family MFS transporter [Salmonella bongori]EDP8705919.1 MHS family MFS transporter [Salmonella bongori]EDP8723649.1 MHS family MFS transporter [Salmonella bongori]EEO9369540.1 MHS family MFS transporter [Salmonella bongori]